MAERQHVRDERKKSPGGWVRIPWMFIAQSESGVQTMNLENCISETHQAVNHRKKDLQISKEIEEIEPTAS